MEIKELWEEMKGMHKRIKKLEDHRNTQHATHARIDYRLNNIYGSKTENVRNSTHTHVNKYMKLKEAREMILEFNGNSQTKLKEFLSTYSYAIKNINPIDERTLLDAILCTKLKGKIMIDFETRDIYDFQQLKSELETCYLSKRSTHLQIKFNIIKQKLSENVKQYGLRIDNLSMELYESMIEE